MAKGSSKSSNGAPRRAARRRRFARRLSVVLLLLGLGALWLFVRISAAPSWWHPPDSSDVKVVEMGHGTEMDVIAAVHRIRPSQNPTWHYRLRNENMNAWLAVNLPKWFEHREGRPWPENVSLPMVSARESGFNLGLKLPEQWGSRILAVRVLPNFEEDGRLRLTLDRVALGRVAVPGAAAEAMLGVVREAFRKDAEEGDLDRIAATLFGETTLSPILRLNDGRIVRLEAIELEDESVVFTCRTLREATSAGDLARRPADPQERQSAAVTEN
jgi:hypothetical protein